MTRAAKIVWAALVALAFAAGAWSQEMVRMESAGAPGLAWIRQRDKAEVAGLRLTLADVSEIDALDAATVARLRAIDLGAIPGRAASSCSPARPCGRPSRPPASTPMMFRIGPPIRSWNDCS